MSFGRNESSSGARGIPAEKCDIPSGKSGILAARDGSASEGNGVSPEKRVIYKARYDSPVGGIVLAAREGHGLMGLWLEGQKYFLGSIREELAEREELPAFLQTKRWLDRYFAGERPEIGELDLAPEGSVFAGHVWKLLQEIPYGETTTYGKIAERIAQERGAVRVSAQAVGGAVAHNPISIIIPCHRVVGSNGSLTGYAGGIDKKLWLLRHEGADLSRCFVPRRGTAL